MGWDGVRGCVATRAPDSDSHEGYFGAMQVRGSWWTGGGYKVAPRAALVVILVFYLHIRLVAVLGWFLG
jgi:hypothetical protein